VTAGNVSPTPILSRARAGAADGGPTRRLGGHRASPAAGGTMSAGADRKARNNPARNSRAGPRTQTGVVFNIPRECGQATFFRCFLERGLVLRVAFSLIVSGTIGRRPHAGARNAIFRQCRCAYRPKAPILTVAQSE
jgi:hypothetical protein